MNDQTIEIARNWFAPDNEGNVWYFGEFTQDFPGGGTEGSWEAGQGEPEARPGIIMMAHPMPGEWTSLEPNSVEHKSYAPGIGLILEEKGGVRLELVP